MKRLVIFILLFIVIIAGRLSGQEVSVSAAFDSSRIFIGDQINFSVRIDQPSGLKLELPSFRDTLIKNIEILSGPVVDTSSLSENRIRVTSKYLITSFDSGYYRIDPVFVELPTENGIKRFFSDYSVLEVARVHLTPPDTASGIFDIIEPYKAPLTLGEILPWILIIIVAGIAIWLLIRFIRKHKKSRKEIIAPVITDPAHVIAFRELEKLKTEQLWQTGDTKKFYTRLTDIIRQYLVNRFNIDSLELTTTETLHAYIKSGLKKDESYNKLKSVLTEADLVKFAKHKPEAAENELIYDRSWDFINLTKLEEQVQSMGDGKEKKSEERV